MPALRVGGGGRPRAPGSGTRSPPATADEAPSGGWRAGARRPSRPARDAAGRPARPRPGRRPRTRPSVAVNSATPNRVRAGGVDRSDQSVGGQHVLDDRRDLVEGDPAPPLPTVSQWSEVLGHRGEVRATEDARDAQVHDPDPGGGGGGHGGLTVTLEAGQQVGADLALLGQDLVTRRGVDAHPRRADERPSACAPARPGPRPGAGSSRPDCRRCASSRPTSSAPARACSRGR